MLIFTGSEFIKDTSEAVLDFTEPCGFSLFEQRYCLPMVNCLNVITDKGANTLYVEEEYGIEQEKQANFIILEGASDLEVLTANSLADTAY
ncbi:hypothetical protein [Psychromonas antarctica]|uniref:hypothetical protein n=1 Tax=Psychromonas antarctica TaxID=67573 RepID=UPI001EE7B78A|nr:hypothetical protein [Psychromonas antarctica]MCG6201686.1 hypothetical protein [Psychromonas antarctica]